MTGRYVVASLLAMLCGCSDMGSKDASPEPMVDDGVETGVARQALMVAPLDKRTIPIRAVHLVDTSCVNRPSARAACGASTVPGVADTLCSSRTLTPPDSPPPDWECPVGTGMPAVCIGSTAWPDAEDELEERLQTVNEIYAAAGVTFKKRSFTTIEAPTFWCTKTPGSLTWGQAKLEVTNAFSGVDGFPLIPANAWADAVVKTGVSGGSDWWKAVAATFAPSDEVIVIISAGGTSGDFPSEGKVVNLARADLDNGTNVLAHELGHYVGLEHTFKVGSGLDPDTGYTMKLSKRYDEVWYHNVLMPEFFTSPSEAEDQESDLQLIANSCSYATDGTCNISCTLAGTTYYPGNSQIDAIVRTSPPGLIVSVNVMDYPPRGVSCPRHISASQADVLWSFLNKEPPVTSSFTNRVSTLPTVFTSSIFPGLFGGALIAGRSRLGLVRSIWSSTANYCKASTERLYVGDFNNDGRSDLLCNQIDDGDMLINRAETNGTFNGSDWTKPARNFCIQSWEHLYVGDFNGDGSDDLLCNQDDGDMLIDYSEGAGVFDGSNWISSGRNFCVGSGKRLYIGDFNGDYRDDLLCNQDDGDMIVDFADTDGEFNVDGNEWVRVDRNFCVSSSERLYIGKFNDDEKEDLLCNQNDGEILIDYANTTTALFEGSNWIQDLDFCLGSNASLHVADINRDGRDDLICRNQSTGKMEVDLVDASGHFAAIEWRGDLDGWCSGSSVKHVFFGDTDNQYGADIICNETDGTLSVASLRMEP
ncbi:FG-GAP-like repeat-containing protein [Polyangium mundeleinium]|uniref:FG-GAP-like repeat-containing protein n=1 Tax=Polyangium mundeleinium TaxID=2995306 RepID=A0ABT5F245_9BACT|nr:FG-GAP-like repeat-containing protein [Polyangium mundeleinium]MDC0747659.1 FG-GAP-like repeat-containing protein [Polyangium mundeleinium]